ncbi:UNVERIFIED_CONTAM: hypothetical protein RKD43_004671 [Streptomyces graminofaciens]
MEVAFTQGFGADSSIVLPRPLTVVFGLNGSGKTRLLRALSESLDDSPIIAIYELVNYLLQDFGKRDDIDGLIDELEPLSPDKVKRDEVQDLVRRDYEEIRWYAASILDSPFSRLVGEDVVPIFVVRHGGRKYDFRAMGLGELSAHLLMWILSYSKGADNTAFLLDEPEAFLPAPSRSVLLAHLLETCINGGKPLVIASHSLEIIQPALDAEAGIMLTTLAGEKSFLGPSTTLNDRVAGLFGKSVDVEWVFLLEDEAATVLMQEIARSVDPRLWQRSRFLWCEGYGDLEAIWSHMPRPKQKIDGMPSFAFVADGDKEGEVEKVKAKADRNNQRGKQRWPFFCLPGDPDSLMKDSSAKQLQFLAERLGVSIWEFSGFLESIQGREPHNWLDEILTFASQSRQEVLKILAISVVMSHTREELEHFLSALRETSTVPQVPQEPHVSAD